MTLAPASVAPDSWEASSAASAASAASPPVTAVAVPAAVAVAVAAEFGSSEVVAVVVAAVVVVVAAVQADMITRHSFHARQQRQVEVRWLRLFRSRSIAQGFGIKQLGYYHVTWV